MAIHIQKESNRDVQSIKQVAQKYSMTEYLKKHLRRFISEEYYEGRGYTPYVVQPLILWFNYDKNEVTHEYTHGECYLKVEINLNRFQAKAMKESLHTIREYLYEITDDRGDYELAIKTIATHLEKGLPQRFEKALQAYEKRLIQGVTLLEIIRTDDLIENRWNLFPINAHLDDFSVEEVGTLYLGGLLPHIQVAERYRIIPGQRVYDIVTQYLRELPMGGSTRNIERVSKYHELLLSIEQGDVIAEKDESIDEWYRIFYRRLIEEAFVDTDLRERLFAPYFDTGLSRTLRRLLGRIQLEEVWCQLEEEYKTA